ncbi:MAG: ElyC/SanA/YdcF family protein [Candidatus Gracilibacteria bacterium]|nr:ElyC/SanA/YdcF family protein [Candidatus Gracilibacteria bacterium]
MQLFFSGGQTSGPEKPSEAQHLRDVYQKAIKELIPEEIGTPIVLLEEGACDTWDNAEKSLALIKEDRDLQNRKLVLFSHLGRLPRIQSIYTKLGIHDADTSSVEEVFWKYVPNGRPFVLRHMFSREIFSKMLMEIPLYILTQFEWGREWIRSKTQKRILETEGGR